MGMQGKTEWVGGEWVRGWVCKGRWGGWGVREAREGGGVGVGCAREDRRAREMGVQGKMGQG